jgi:hypothetical protein
VPSMDKLQTVHILGKKISSHARKTLLCTQVSHIKNEDIPGTII